MVLPCICLDEAGREARALDRRLGDATHGSRRLDVQQLQQRRHNVDGMGVLTAQLTPGLNSRRPLNDERVGDAALVNLALPALEGVLPAQVQPKG